MRILRPLFYTMLVVALSSCSATKSITKRVVPPGTNAVVDIPAKKAELSDYEKYNWHHLDLASDSIPGMSVIKAYEFLSGKQGVEVVVAVVDTGTDLKHEDLKEVAWVNKGEISGNGIDDDKNGFIDDVNGWNFLGKVYKEHYEFERIMQNPSIADTSDVKKVNILLNEKVEKAKKSIVYFKGVLSKLTAAKNFLVKHFGTPDFTKEQVLALKQEGEHTAIAKNMFLYFDNLDEATSYFQDQLQKDEDLVNGKVLQKNYREVLGDNPEDIKDSPGYGDAHTKHIVKEESHGTHVSGIIAASRANGKGMDGVASNVKIMAVRAVPDGDEYDKDIALGIRYAVDNGAKIINASFGKSFSPHKKWVFDAIKYAAKKDVLIVNAAGNSSKDIDKNHTFPNDAPDLMNEVADNFITIGAIDYGYNEKLLAPFTNYGKHNVDVFAPGMKIYSTTPEGEYDLKNGTSMAAPAVAGVAALIRSHYPQLSDSQVKRIIMNSGTKIDFEVLKPGSVTRKNPDGELVSLSELSVSGRIVNAYDALRFADKIVNSQAVD